MNELALFAGAGGGILGGKLLGWRTVCAVEWEPYAACVLAARQNDGILPAFPIWDDVQTFDGRPWRGIVDVVSGGFPCQDISSAGKGAGIDGERSGMWREMARIIGEVRPRFAFVENSPVLTSRGLDRVLGDLAEMGFDAKWGVVSAADVGAPHRRDRIWIVAHSIGVIGDEWRAESERQLGQAGLTNGGNDVADAYDSRQRAGSWHRESQGEFKAGNYAGRCGEDLADAMRERNRRKPGETNKENEEVWADGIGCSHEAIDIHSDVADADLHGWRDVSGGERARTEFDELGVGGSPLDDADGPGLQGAHEQPGDEGLWGDATGSSAGAVGWWSAEPNVGRVAHGVAARVDRLRAIGNGQVPLVAATAFELLTRK